MVLNLDTLTEELLNRIVSFVSPHSSLWSLVLVSRTLNRLATPYLYETVNFKGASPDTGIRHLIPFAFLAFQKPYIASSVRSLSIRDTYGTPDQGLEPLNDDDAQSETDETEDKNEESHGRKGWPNHPDRDQIIRSAIEGVGYTGGEVDRWFTALLEGDDEATILSILLPHLKKLRRLDLSQDWIGDEDDLVSTFRKASKREEPFNQGDSFTCLTDILVAGYGDKYPVSPIMLGACLGLPALRRLHGLKMGENEQDEATQTMIEIPKGSSSIEEIELRETKLYSEDLKLLLSVPKALKTFIYDLGHSWAWYAVDTNDILEGLSHHTESLQSLVLDHPDYAEEMDNDYYAPMEFSAFTKLGYLKASVLYLGGSGNRDACSLKKTFPQSLKKLCVTYFGEGSYCPLVMYELHQVLEQKEQYLPNLEELILEGQFKKQPETLELAKDIMRCVSAKGVRVELVDDAYRRTWSGSEQGWGVDEAIDWQPTLARGLGEREILNIEL